MSNQLDKLDDLQFQVQLLNDKVYGELENTVDKLDVEVNDISKCLSNTCITAYTDGDAIATTAYVNTRLEEVLKESDLIKLYHNIFDILCERQPQKKDKYKALFKIYGEDYRSTVIVIETMNIKEEKEKLLKDLS